MKLGTKSVLYGAHAFYLHPWFVAWSWWKLYGFPFDPRLWVAFFVHDLGYIGKPNMDGIEGEHHPILGARIMAAMFDAPGGQSVRDESAGGAWVHGLGTWGQFALLHSRYFAKRLGATPSRLCIADKLALALTPAWLYLPMVRATGEIHEYMMRAHQRADSNERLLADERAELTSDDQRRWYAAVQAYMVRWVDEHKDGRADEWTASAAQGSADTKAGVWR